VLPRNRRSGPWRLEAGRPDGSALVIEVAEGGCLRFERLDVTEVLDQVVITSVLRDTTRAGIVCNASLTTHPVEVTLRQELGRRTLVHAPVEVLTSGLT
jgi:hypothetical protein